MKAKNKTAWPLYALVLVFLHVVSAAAGPLEDAEAAIKRRDYTTAARIIRPLAESGDATAQHNLGVIHFIQWRLLGAKDFLRVYADGLERFGYMMSPLEKMAYDAEAAFSAAGTFDAELLVSDALAKLRG
jgi:hypothetical protein